MRQLLALFLLTTFAWASGDGPAELPRLTVDTSVPSTAGYTVVNVTSGNFADLQSKINAAGCGTVINVPANANYVGNLSIPATICDATHWIIVQSTNIASLPAAGIRIDPSYTTNLPHLAPGNNQAAAVSAGHHSYWRFQGLEIMNDNTQDINDSLVNLTTGAETLVANEPDHIIFDRIYFHGTTQAQNKATRHGIQFGGPYQAVINSYFEQIVDDGSDAQCFHVFNSPGPIDFENNWCENSSEGFMLGATDPRVANLITQDITIKNNVFYKALTWKSNEPDYVAQRTWLIKNGAECKSGQRILIENNIFDNSWAGAQVGQGLLLAARTAAGTCPQCKCADATVRYNLFRHMGSFLGISGSDQPGAGSLGWSGGTFRISVHDNVGLDTNTTSGAGQWLGGAVGSQTGPGVDAPISLDAYKTPYLSYDHNSFLQSMVKPWSILGTGFQGMPWLSITNNLVDFGTYGLFVNGGLVGTAGLNATAGITWTYVGNVMNNIVPSGYTAGQYPAGNQTCGSGSCFPAPGGSTYSVFQLANETNCTNPPYDPAACALAAGSPYHNGGTDSRDIGADAAGLAVRVGSLIHLWKVVSVSPATVTHGNSTVLTLIVKNINTINGALPTVAIGGQACTSPTTTYDGQRMTCVMPTGLGAGTYSIVVTDNGESATLTNGITFN